jgi:hypothetical protein
LRCARSKTARARRCDRRGTLTDASVRTLSLGRASTVFDAVFTGALLWLWAIF